MQIVDTETGETLYDSRWQFPELLGYQEGSKEYKAIQKLWRERRNGNEQRKDKQHAAKGLGKTGC